MRRRQYLAVSAAAVLSAPIRSQQASSDIPAGQSRIGTYTTGPAFEQYLQGLRPGDTVRFEADGRSYTGTYFGERVIDGVKQHVAINVRPDGPTPQTPGTPAGPQASDRQGGQGRGGSGNGVGDPLGAAGGAAGIHAIYRVAFVSPGLDRELARARQEFDAATAARQAAITDFRLTVERSIADASTSLQLIGNALEKGLPTVPDLLRRGEATAVQFNTEDLVEHARLSNAYYQTLYSRVQSPIHQFTKGHSLRVLETQNSLDRRDGEDRETLLQYSESLASFLRSSTDLLLGIDPVSGLVRDTYELYTGTNLVTGAALSDVDRALRAVGIGVNLATLGAAGTVMGGIKATSRIVEKLEKPAREAFEKIYVIVDGLPFSKHGMEEFTSRGLELTIFSTRETRLTPDWIKRTIEEGAPYWDRVHNTIAFHSQSETGAWLRVAISPDAHPRIVTVVPRSVPFSLLEKVGDAPRFIPYDKPVPRVVIE
jgi:hypothetical protein